MASELCKRGYDVAFTVGNHTPDADIVAIGPSSHRPILIDVKGQSSRSFWRIKSKPQKAELWYILPLVRLDKETEFFIMSEEEVRHEQEIYKNSGIKYDDRFSGFNWGTCKKYGGSTCWERLPK